AGGGRRVAPPHRCGGAGGAARAPGLEPAMRLRQRRRRQPARRGAGEGEARARGGDRGEGLGLAPLFLSAALRALVARLARRARLTVGTFWRAAPEPLERFPTGKNRRLGIYPVGLARRGALRQRERPFSRGQPRHQAPNLAAPNGAATEEARGEKIRPRSA